MKPTKIEDILNVGAGFVPPVVAASASMAPNVRDLVKETYSSVYGNGIDKFLETRWFTTRGLTHLLQNPLLCEKYAMLISRFDITAASNYQENLVTQSLEAHVVWETMLLCRQVSASINTTNDSSAVIETNEGVHDAAKRVEVFEALITNQQLDPANAITETSGQAGSITTLTTTTALDDQLKTRERDFWRLVSKFCTLKYSPQAPPATGSEASAGPSSNPATEIDGVLGETRVLLDSRENRDVLYSIAIARHWGQRLAERAEAEGGKLEQPVSNDEGDPRNKLRVARDFITAEAGGKGTTQVVQRICGMAVMSWGAGKR